MTGLASWEYALIGFIFVWSGFVRSATCRPRATNG
jgi:hypothetical protein